MVTGAQRGNNGASSANLRGQGSAATLVLLNGRRVAAHGLNGGVVDLNSIPFAAIERVERLNPALNAIVLTNPEALKQADYEAVDRLAADLPMERIELTSREEPL